MKISTIIWIGLLSAMFIAPVSANNGSAMRVDVEPSIPNGATTLWYPKPATVWNEALPIGNGRLAAMITGDPAKEQLQLNEATFWSGGPSRNDNPDGVIGLDSIRRSIQDGDFRRADQLSNRYLTAKRLHGSKFQNAGFLNLQFEGHETYTDYQRRLDLEKALFTCTYSVNGVRYTREVLASIPDQVIVVRLTADRKGALTFNVGFDGPLKQTNKVLGTNMLEMTALSGNHEGVTGQVELNTRAVVKTIKGQVTQENEGLKVTGADEVLIYVSMATNVVNYADISADEAARCQAPLDAAIRLNWKKLYQRHLNAYQAYFNRVKLDLGNTPAAQRPTDERVRTFAQSNDPALVSLYFQFGRYLLIASSQPGGQPANLQGLWNGSVNPAWDSKYTININTEMNYWPAEKCNLADMHEPLIQLVKDLSETGKETARVLYGCDGWVAHHNTDLWRITGVVDFANAGQWPMGGAWLSQHLWEKYLYSGDKTYLATIYPVLRSASAFFEDFLIEEPGKGWLVVSPSISPENTPQGHASALTAGTTMDNQLVFDLFTKTIAAANVLNKPAAEVANLQRMLDKLPPMQVGKHGQLQEWLYDWDNPNDKHRHISHLYGLHPGNQISPYRTPKLFDAARTSLVHRGDVSTGWSMGWKVNTWARLLDGNRARKLITDQLTLVDPVRGRSGGTYPNLFDAHPPFQIDGNFGCTAGIAEMLMQCHDGSLHLLPALPDDWATGSISGLRAYGGFEVSFAWKNGQVETITLTSKLGGNCRIRVPNRLEPVKGMAEAKGSNPNPFYETPDVKPALIAPDATLNPVKLPATLLYDLPTKAGESYILKAVAHMR